MARRSEGVSARRLDDRDLKRELQHLHETRSDAFFDGSRSAFRRHVERTEELENEYVRRHPGDVEADPQRTRAGARLRAGQRVDGAGVGRDVRRKSAQRRDRQAGAKQPEAKQPEAKQPGAGDGFERRQGTRRRRRFENMQQGPAFARHTLGTTGTRPKRDGRPRRRTDDEPDVNRRTRGSAGSGSGRDRGERVPARARGGRREEMTYRSGKRTPGRTTGRGRGVPGLPGSYARKGGTPQRGAGKATGAANRRYGKSISAKARPARRGGRRPNSGMQG